MKIKKCTSLFLSFLLLVSNIGLAFNVHYCGNTIASVSLKTVFQSSNQEKSCCGIVEKKSSCCKDKQFKLQKKSDDSVVKTFSFQIGSPYIIAPDWKPIIFSPVTIFSNKQISEYYCDAHAPPLFKLYSQYIFYA